jgi:hypothetical protein
MSHQVEGVMDSICVYQDGPHDMQASLAPSSLFALFLFLGFQLRCSITSTTTATSHPPFGSKTCDELTEPSLSNLYFAFVSIPATFLSFDYSQHSVADLIVVLYLKLQVALTGVCVIPVLFFFAQLN